MKPPPANIQPFGKSDFPKLTDLVLNIVRRRD